MVYIHIPENLTEEEQMLMAKYAKLKKKKKQVQALKTKAEPEKPLIPKRPNDARDAREVARKLIKSGNINIVKTEAQQQLFKRPKGQERKKNLEPTTTHYHPFSSASDIESVETVPKSPVEKPDRSISFLYQQQFDKEKDVDKKQSSSGTPQREKPPKTGYTIYVSGKSITEDFLKKHFSEFGSIVNVSMEIEKGRGFVTFSKTEATDRAIAEMHGKMTSGIQLTVSLARKQPNIEPINDASSSATWSALAVSQSQKGNHKDALSRELVIYDDIFDFQP